MEKPQASPQFKANFPSAFNGLKPVIVRVPAKHLFELKSIRQITESVLERLGCPNCHSGHDIRFLAIDDFIVNDKLEVSVHEQGLLNF